MSTYIIAEVGVNHNGDVNIAKKLIREAKNIGVDCVKFQTYITSNIVSKFAEKAEYQKARTSETETQSEMLKKLELTFDEFRELKNYCMELEIEFLSTPFDLESVEFLMDLGVDKWKVPSGDITNLPYLIKIAESKKPIILSTGMCTNEEVKIAIRVLEEHGASEITLLHCTTEYPAPFSEVNLKAMATLREAFGYEVGYSDHTEGIEVSIAATALGACVIEKHFTLDKSMEGPDHSASLEPKEFKQLIESIRNIEKAMGSGVKNPTESELKNKEVARKSIVAKQRIMAGELITEDKITIKRPGNGISPMKWNSVIGKSATRDYEEDEMIKE